MTPDGQMEAKRPIFCKHGHDLFVTQRVEPNGLKYCITCKRTSQRKWRNANRERHNESNRRAYAVNPTAKNEYSRKWDASHRESRRKTSRKWRIAHPETALAWRLKKKFNISLLGYKSLFNSQKGVCASCGQTNKSGRRLHIDHDHASGEIRGLLCSNCNMAIGLLGDSLVRVQRLAEYLRKRAQLRLVSVG